MLEQRPNLNDIIDHEIVVTESVESTSENKVEQSPSSENHKCEKCDYETNTESDLKTHMQAKHKKHKTIKCWKCDFRTKIKEDLTEIVINTGIHT